MVADRVRLRKRVLDLQDRAGAIAANKDNACCGVLTMSTEQFVVRGVGLIRTVEDIAGIVVKEAGGIPVYVGNLGEVRIGSEVRQGAIIKGGYTEAVSGIVLMMRAGNAKEIVTRVKALSLIHI